MEFPVLWIASLIIGGIIGHTKNRIGSGFIWPLVLGPFGVIVVALLPTIKNPENDKKLELQAQQIELQREQIRQLQQLNARATAGQAPPPLPHQVPAPPGEAVAAAFKFACPRCGQRISTTTAFVGTLSSCPTCQGEFTVPPPSAAV